MIKINFLKTSIIFFLFAITSLYSEIETRGAIDIGSQESKVTVADVDTETNQIVHIWFQDFKTVKLRQDLSLSSNGSFSPSIQKELLDTLKEWQKVASTYLPTKWAGIGTASFRSAKNGQDFLDLIKMETGIAIRLAAQAEEGEIGFLTAVAASQLSPEDVMVWDSGSGSFQISSLINGLTEVYGAEFGYTGALQTIFKIRNQKFSPTLSPNPVSLAEINQLVASIQENFPPIPEWLKEKDKTVIGCGTPTNAFSIGQIATGHSTYTKDQLWEAIVRLSGSTDEQLSNFPEPTVYTLAMLPLVYAVMDHCGIEQISFYPANGSCEGLLIMPRFWE